MEEASDARIAANRAAEAAWETVRNSPYAAVLGATQYQAPDVDTLAARLTEMRETKVPARVQQIDTGDERRLSRAHGQAAKAREDAAMYRAVTTDARTEKALRARIAEHHPVLHQSEARARAEVQRAQEARNARVEQQNRPAYQPPSAGRSGPSRGMR